MRQSWSDERARFRKVHVTIGQGCRFGRCAVKAVKFTSGGLHRVPIGLREPRGPLTAVQKSADGIVGDGHEPENPEASPH